jgi:hypothetical protein
LLGADGAASLVRRQVFRPFARADLSIATGCFVRNRSSRDIVVAFGTIPGLPVVVLATDHLAVGACAQADQTTSPALLRTVTRWVARRGSRCHGRAVRWPIPSLQATLATEQVAGDRWMLLGDAAGMVGPSREGIYFALRSGDLAADALIADRDPPASRDPSHGDTPGTDVRGSAQGAILSSPIHESARGCSRHEPRIGAVMTDLVAGRQPYHNLRRRLLQTLDFRLMLELFGY